GADGGRLGGDDVPEAEKHADNVYVDDPPEVGERVVGNRTHRPLDAGVVEKNVDAAGSALGIGDVATDRILVGDIGLAGCQVELRHRPAQTLQRCTNPVRRPH